MLKIDKKLDDNEYRFLFMEAEMLPFERSSLEQVSSADRLQLSP